MDKNYSLKKFDSYSDYKEYATSKDGTIFYYINYIPDSYQNPRSEDRDVICNGEHYYAFYKGGDFTYYTKTISETEDFINVDVMYTGDATKMINMNILFSSESLMVSNIRVSNNYLRFDETYICDFLRNTDEDITYNSELYFAYDMNWRTYGSMITLYSKTILPIEEGNYEIELTDLYYYEENEMFTFFDMLDDEAKQRATPYLYKVTKDHYLEPHVSFCADNTACQYNKKTFIATNIDENDNTMRVYSTDMELLFELEGEETKTVSIITPDNKIMTMSGSVYNDIEIYINESTKPLKSTRNSWGYDEYHLPANTKTFKIGRKY